VNTKVATKQTMKSSSFTHAIRFAACIALLLLGFVACGGGKQAQAPPDLIRDYVAKHAIMIDTSLADLYVEEEQKNVLHAIEKSIAASKEDGTYEGLSQASFDFSEMTIETLDAKDAYVNDESKDFLKVATKGSVSMIVSDTTKKIPADTVLILEKDYRENQSLELIHTNLNPDPPNIFIMNKKGGPALQWAPFFHTFFFFSH
jgi:hypothetical protein